MNAAVSEKQRHVLLVEDEVLLARTLGDMLQAEGYGVVTRGDGEAALEAACQGSHDLILLDVMLPSMDGFEVSSNLRRRGIQTPILMLTARDELGDKVGGLRAGADDYLTKPFEVEELLARMEALLRRANREVTADLETYSFGDVRIDFSGNRVFRGDERMELAEQEWQLMRYLVAHRGEVVSRETLLREVWGYKAVPFTRTVDVHVAWLRQKIEPAPQCPRFIITIRGQGYRFDG